MEPGTKLGPYEITEQLGAGGMGVVYLAQDTRLGRKVAIKVLPAEFASDPERLARFEQEARAAAALNHPHIASVFDVGTEDGTHFMVQEYLEGETLREPLRRGALPLPKALDFTTQIAEALAAAHAAGIVHRDIKPENIFVTGERHAKVLDFGLAKLIEVSSAGEGGATQSPTMVGTVAGQVMGTAGYMAPEQVDGTVEIDHRADLFACGCVLYETVSGIPPFAGESLHDTLHRIGHAEPTPVTEVAADAPAQLQWIVSKCLAKDRAHRYQSAADLAVDLRRLSVDVRAGTTGVATRAPDSERKLGLSHLAIGVAAAALAAVMTVLLTRSPDTAPDTSPTRHLALATVEGVYERPHNENSKIAISPDGQRLVFATEGSSLQVLDLSTGDIEPIPGTDGGVAPFYSPSGQLGFYAVNNRLTLVPQGGGRPEAIPGAITERVTSVSWTTGDTILFSTGFGGMVRHVPASGGTPAPLLGLQDDEIGHSFASLLPDGDHVLHGFWDTDWRIAVRSLSTGRRTLLVGRGFAPSFAPSGHLIYVRENVLMAAPFDPETLAVGESVQVLDNVLTNAAQGTAAYAFTADGSLAYLTRALAPRGRLIRIDFDDGIRPIGDPEVEYQDIALSPDGRHVASAIVDPVEGEEVWVHDLVREDRVPIGQGAGWDHYPVFSPDGSRVAYVSERLGSGDVFVRAANGSGPEREVVVGPDYKQNLSWSPDDVLAVTQSSDHSRDVWVYPIDASDGGTPFLTSTADEETPSFSPDGRHLAFASDRTGRSEIYVTPYPAGPAAYEWKVTTTGGTRPRWSDNGQQLFYQSGDRVFVVDVIEGNDLTTSTAELVVEGVGSEWDVSSTLRFVIALAPTEPAQPHLVLNWFDELNQLVPTDGS